MAQYGSDDDYSSDTTSKRKRGSGAVQGGLRAAGSGLSQMGRDFSDSARSETDSSIHAVSYKRGGKIRKTGLKNVHKDERVIPSNKRKKVERMMKRSGMSLTNKKRKGKRSSGRD